MNDDNNFLEGRTVLIVDDDSRNIFALKSYLVECGITIYTAASGTECLDILNKPNSIEVVLMDMMMPELDGFQTIKIIRNTPSLQSIPIISVTAKAMKGDREKCLEAGATEYVSKPVDMKQLLDKIALLLSFNK